jgi:gamma-glutamyltranspeptidase/glutathione hydrolase
MLTTGRGQAQGFAGVVASPHHLTSLAAMAVLEQGGNAVDAAIAANAVQGTVAPETCGIGGDLFALVWNPGNTEPAALNASGWAGSNASAERLRAEGHTEIPDDHRASVSIPGAVAGWYALAERFGTRSVGELLDHAIAHATEGFAASGEYSRAVDAKRPELSTSAAGRELIAGADEMMQGYRVRRPALASTLERIALNGPGAFYEGPVAADISTATGGMVTTDDLAGYLPDWVVPVGKEVFGGHAWTIGPNSQGYLTLATLRILEMVSDGFDPADPESHHHLIEAYRSVAQERDDLVTDARFAPMTGDELLADDRLAAIAGGIGPTAGRYRSPSPKPGGTAYLCAVDSDGLAVSLIQSNFHGLGSLIGTTDSGFLLHNRGAGACLEPGHPNELSPGKRPLHTLSPTIWSTDGSLRMVLGTRGGHQQPQLLAQVAAHLSAGDAPWVAQARPRWSTETLAPGTESKLRLESAFDPSIVADLEARGHQIELIDGYTGGWGPISMILVEPTGLRTAAADPRVDTSSALVS